MKNQKGFTLVELLVVIAIVGILVAIIFVALDPATRFQQARDAVRQNDVQEILSAIKLHQVDNGGAFPDDLDAATLDHTNADVYMFAQNPSVTLADTTSTCDTDATSTSHVADIDELVDENYLAELPISPSGAITWDDGDTAAENGTGYLVSINSAGIVTVHACESEHSGNSAISASR